MLDDWRIDNMLMFVLKEINSYLYEYLRDMFEIRDGIKIYVDAKGK